MKVRELIACLLTQPMDADVYMKSSRLGFDAVYGLTFELGDGSVSLCSISVACDPDALVTMDSMQKHLRLAD